MNNTFKFYVNRNIASDSFDLYLKRTTESGSSMGINIMFTKLEPGLLTSPILKLREEEAQELLEELWGAGFRPKEVGTAGQLSAVQYHLENMRKLVFNERLSTKPL